jgi:hypothetical protein
MVRYVVYPHPNNASVKGKCGTPVDSVGDKLVKYVPAEIIALFNLIYLACPKSKNDDKPADKRYVHTIILLLFFCLTPLYHLARGATEVPGKRRGYFLPLTALGFVGWALGTTTFLQDMLGEKGVNDVVPVSILVCTVFLVPLVDEGFSRCIKKT